MTTSVLTRPRTVNQLTGLVFGTIYLLIGLIGFAITPGVGFAATHGKDFLFFMVNPLHNLVHIAIGLGLLGAAAAGPRVSRTVNATVGTVYFAVGLIGLFILHSSLNILALNIADNGLHFASAAVLLLAGVLGVRRQVPEPA